MHKEQYLTFEKAQKLVQKLKIESYREYEELYKQGKLPNFPAHPDRFWGKEKRKIDNNYIIDYKKARRIARKLKLKRLHDYLDLGKQGKLPEGLPKRPEHYYKDFVSWKDFLNTKNVVKKGYSREGKKFWDYKRASKYIQKIGIVSERQFRRAKKEGKVSLYVPKDPSSNYKEWKTWEKFFGKNNRNGNYATYEECKTWAKKHKIKNRREWEKKRPKNMPRHLKMVYKEWEGWNEFLGNYNNRHFNTNWLSFKEAKKIVQAEGITSAKEFQRWVRETKPNIPASPHIVYGEKN